MPTRDAVVVAGGRGTRLQPLTHDVPKPLVEFCGAPFLVGVLRRLADAGVARVLLVVGQRTAPFEPLRGTGARLGLEVRIVPEPTPLDTAGGVRAVAQELSAPVLVLNGDVLHDVDLAAAVAHHRDSAADATLVLTRVEDTSAFGVCVREGTRIVDFVEKPPPGTLPGQDAVNAGTYVLDPGTLTRWPQGRLSFERDVFPRLVADGGRLEGVVDDGAWADLGTPARLRAGHRLALDGAVSWPTLRDVPADAAGVRVADGVRVDGTATLRGPVLLLPGAAVARGARVGPYVVLGAGASVGADAELTDVVVGADAVVGRRVRARELVVGPGAVLADDVVVIGDAVVAAGRTIAAGTVLQEGARVPAPAG